MENNIVFNKNKRIGKVLFIVEGEDEIYILNKIFTGIFNYQYESKNRLGKYRPHNLKDNPSSSIFVINTKESNIKSIYDVYDADGYLSDLFTELINEYNFAVDKCAIFYLFDRDIKSNTDHKVFEELIDKLSNSRESNEEFEKAGLLLLSYPAIESFIVSNFTQNSFDLEYELGSQIKKYLGIKHWSKQRIKEDSVENSINELLMFMESIGEKLNLDDIKTSNKVVYQYQDRYYNEKRVFRLVSLLAIALIDLGLVEVIEED